MSKFTLNKNEISLVYRVKLFSLRERVNFSLFYIRRVNSSVHFKSMLYLDLGRYCWNMYVAWDCIFSCRLQICTFSGLVIGWWSKLRAAHPYPTQSWVLPPPSPIKLRNFAKEGVLLLNVRFSACYTHMEFKARCVLIAKYIDSRWFIDSIRSSVQNGSSNASEFCSLSKPDSARSPLKVAEISL